MDLEDHGNVLEERKDATTTRVQGEVGEDLEGHEEGGDKCEALGKSVMTLRVSKILVILVLKYLWRSTSWCL